MRHGVRLIVETPTDAALLIVNDRKDALLALTEVLRPLNVAVVTALSATEGLRLSHERTFAVAVVDICMPEMDGFALVERIRADPNTRELPVIFVSGVDATPETRERVYQLGAVDFLPLPVPPEELRSKVGIFVQLQRKTRTLEEQARMLSRRADRALREQEERFRLFLETASDFAILFTDASGEIREWTAGAERVLGYSATEAVGRPLSFIFTPEDQAAGVPQREMDEAIERGEAIDERWHQRKDGARFFAVGRLIALRDDGLKGFVKILRDATAARQADEQLREALERFESLAESMQQMAWMAEPSGARTWFNRRWFEYTGTTIEEMRGWGFASVYDPAERADIVVRVQERAATGSEWSEERRLRGRDGEYRWFQTQGAPVRDASGAIVRWFGTNTDIHAQVLLRERLKSSEQKFREIFETANEGIWLLNSDGQVEMVNERMAQLLGYEIPEILGRLKTDFVFPEDIGYVRGLFEQRRRGEFASVDVRFRRKDGQPVWTLLSARPMIRDGVFAGALDMFTDVSARKDAARQFEDVLKAQVAERTRALQEKSQQLERFAYTIAHDLRSPLRAISGYAEITLEDHRPQLPDDAVVNLEKIRQSAARLDGLIRDLLSYTRVSQVDFVEEDVSVNSAVVWAIEHLRPEIERRKAQIDMPAEMPAVRGERTILDQVFLNLLSNAIKFVPPEETPRITFTVDDKGPLVRVNVRDNGIGIPKEYQERIFRVFERLQGSLRVEGTGVGLAIVARAAERLGGRAGVDSTPRQGSTFWIELRKAKG